MSVQAMTWAFQQQVEPHAKLVLLALANRANHETGTCFPGQELLAAECSMSVRTIRRHLKSLEDAGFITRRARMRGDGRGRTSDEYRLVLNQPDSLTGKLRPTGQTETTNRTEQDDQPDTVVRGTVSEPEEEPLATASRERPRDLLFETIAELCGYTLTALTKTARGRLNAAVKELRDINATPDQIRQVVRAYRRTYPDATVTPQAITGNWAAMATGPARPICECGQYMDLHDQDVHDIVTGGGHA